MEWITQGRSLRLFSWNIARTWEQKVGTQSSGHGLPILGDANMEIKMTIGSKVATVDGKKGIDGTRAIYYARYWQDGFTS